MALSTVIFRNPFPPHEALAYVDAQNVSYGRLLMAPSTASFQVRSEDSAELNNLEHQFGALITIQQDDELYPWVGMVTKRTMEMGATSVQFEAQDHIGALFARAHTHHQFAASLGGLQNIFAFTRGDAASQIDAVLKEVAQRNSPPLLVEHDFERGGPDFWYLPEGESVLDYIQEVHDMTGWEWGVKHAINLSSVSSTLLWRRRIGVDRRDEVEWDENRHFTRLSFTQDASKFIETAVVASMSVDEEQVLFWAVSTHTPRMALPPALRGGVLAIRQQTKSQAHIQAEADRMANDPTNRGEHLSFAVSEDTITEHVDPGDQLRVRFKNAGNTVERVVRVLGTQHNSGSGVVEVEADVEPEDEDER